MSPPNKRAAKGSPTSEPSIDADILRTIIHEENSKSEERLLAKLEEHLTARLVEFEAQITARLDEQEGRFKHQNDRLDNEMRGWKHQMDNLDNQSRKNNLIITGLPVEQGEDCTATAGNFLVSLGVINPFI